MNALPMPRPIRKKRAEDRREEVGVRADAWQQRRARRSPPACRRPSPAARRSGRPAERVTPIDRAATVSVQGMNARPVCIARSGGCAPGRGVPRKNVEYMPVTRKPRTMLEATRPRTRQDPQRHDRVLDARLEREERGQQRDRDGRQSRAPGSSPSRGWSPRRSRRRRCHQRAVTSTEPSQSTPCPRPRPVSRGISARPARTWRAPIGRLTKKIQCQLSACGEHAAGEQAERTAGDRREHVGAHRAGAIGRLGELGDDDREDHRGLERGADALEEASADQDALSSARRRTAPRRRVNSDHAEQEHALATEQVAEPAGQQQEAAERDEERVDDPGEVALGEVEVVLDRGQRDVHDRRVEHDHQLRQADDDERQPAPAISGRWCEARGIGPSSGV